MVKVGVQEAKTHFSQLIDRALNGEEIVVARHGKGLVRLVPLESNQSLRPVGLHEQVIPEDFLEQLLEPLPQDLLGSFFETTKFDDIAIPKKAKK